MKAKYKCCSCGYEYEDEPGPTECPICYHLYVKWVNYEEWCNDQKTLEGGD